MKLSRVLSALLPSTSSQAGESLLLRTANALQASFLSTGATAKPASRKGTRTEGQNRAGAEALTQPVPSEEEAGRGGSPPQAPAQVDEEAAQRRKPSEIPWQAKAANSVQLIGHLGTPVQLGVSPDGAYTAVSVLLHEKTHDLPQFWIPLVFQGDLAQIAACNLREKDHVYVNGQLTGGSQLIDSNPDTKMQVMVYSISYVHDLQSEKKHYRNSKGLVSTSAEVKDTPSVMQLWNDLFANPHKWWDYRPKGNNKSGMFKHKDSGQLLEINEATPEWVLSKLDTLIFSSRTSSINSQNANAKTSGESLAGYWNELVENPQLWWDNREDKLNGKIGPKRPDFTHKVTRTALWLDSAPDWVLSKLENPVVSEACWQSEAKKINTRLAKKEVTWRNLVENPDKWLDQRSNKSKRNAPDFKHKETGEALWLDSTMTPKWVLDKFPPTNADNQ